MQLSGTLSPSRWRRYARLLDRAGELGYSIRSLEDWLLGAEPRAERTLILRHDVDQHPRSAERMAAIERDVGVRSTWYFRWRTAEPELISSLRQGGWSVGLHYETLTRAALRSGGLRPARLGPLRRELRSEVESFERLFGPIESFAAHGDSRVPGINNLDLVHGEDPGRFGVRLDANESLRAVPVAEWVSDRSDGGWSGGLDPVELLERGMGPILCLTHPNNWAGGARLWGDRLVTAGLPTPTPGERSRPVRTRGDDPPRIDPAGQALTSAVPFEPVADSLREVLLDRYEAGPEIHLGTPAGRNTLETNSTLAARRAEILMRMITRGIGDLDGRRLLDIGCGFGALSLFFATQGARVVGMDVNRDRLEVGREVAAAHALDVKFVQMPMEHLRFRPERFAIAIMNNSLCYLDQRDARRRALAEAHRVLLPGGLLAIRNPNLWNPVDQFTNLPLIHALPPRVATRAAGALARPRSTVRLLSPPAAARELRRAGFTGVTRHSQPGRPPPLRPFARYQHLSARKPRA